MPYPTIAASPEAASICVGSAVLVNDDGVVKQITEAINTAIKRAPRADLEWVSRHLVYHKETSYLVIPNLYSFDPNDEEEGKGVGNEPNRWRAH